MEILESPLVLTKIRVPATRVNCIPRTRLVDLLAPEAGHGFILVSAPAGYGKTTLLAEWAQSLLKKGAAVAWYALDASDDDPIPFGAYLIASLAHALGPASALAHIAQIQRASTGVDLQGILPPIINNIVSSGLECVLVLDDYHLITSPAIHSAVSFLMEHLPENLRIVIGSRSDPPLPLARMRVRAQMVEIRSANLRFTGDETELFLNKLMKLDLSPRGMLALEERTEGWIAGLQLAALWLAGRPDKEEFIADFSGSHRYLVEYLLEEVVNCQSQEVQSFLLATSILERMCAPLCDVILGEGFKSESILSRLEQANLFVVALDDQGYWYRYHHLFRDFLHSRLLKNQPETETSSHRKACEWLAEHHFLREAAQHAFQTRDWSFAAAFVEQHSFTMIIHSEIATIYEWCSAFPEEVMQLHPMLCILQCWAWVFSFRRENRPRIEARLHQAEQIISGIQDRQMVRELNEHAAVVRTFLMMAPDPAADPRQQLAVSQNMLALYPEGDAGQFSALLTSSYASMALNEASSAVKVLEKARQIAISGRFYFGIVESSFHLARLAHCQGRLNQAIQICRQGQDSISAIMAHPEQELPALGCLDVALGCMLLEQDQLVEAEEHLLHGLNIMGMGMNPYYLLAGYTALARLREIQRRPEEALIYLTDLEETWPDILFCTGGLRVMLTLRAAPEDAATLEEAAAWGQSFSSSFNESLPLPGIGPFGAAEAYYLAHLTWMRVNIALGKTKEIRPTLEHLLNIAFANDLTGRVIELSLLDALCAQVEGDRQHARKALEHALSAGQQAGYIRTFDQGPVLTQLLVEAAQSGICVESIHRLLAVIGLPDSPGPIPEGTAARRGQTIDLKLVETLSERELEVVRLMAEGATNQAIAGQLVITVGTVKSHINHILGKLAAQNRTEAVAQARKLGLI